MFFEIFSTVQIASIFYLQRTYFPSQVLATFFSGSWQNSICSPFDIADSFIRCQLFSKYIKTEAREDESHIRTEIKEQFILQISLKGFFFFFLEECNIWLCNKTVSVLFRALCIQLIVSRNYLISSHYFYSRVFLKCRLFLITKVYS